MMSTQQRKMKIEPTTYDKLKHKMYRNMGQIFVMECDAHPWVCKWNPSNAHVFMNVNIYGDHSDSQIKPTGWFFQF